MPPLVYAHRGASGLYPENTMEAFLAAEKKRADGIELDVQLSHDDKLVVIHDHLLDRTTNGSGLVRQTTWASLRKLRANQGHTHRFPHARIPSLREVLHRFADSKLKLIIEMKNLLTPQPGMEQKLIALIRHYDLTERTVISSFNFDSLSRIKQIDPLQTTGLLYIGSLPAPWEVAARYQANQLHIPQDQLTPDLVHQAQAHGFPVIGWTINSEAEIRDAIRTGVNGIITNYPGRARKILRSRR
ncbi:glycerophosphodiester phosphodiesterase [Brevibacillus sp. TJ4]|uniref:glycerophosphodiester phosphodiesterase n=1 Tax=Brevibacillus sp. TJ4 TaxID=3234853 RepID=UPI003B9F5BD0